VEAEVTITKQQCVPINTHEWEKSTKTYQVSYLVQELGRLDMFGLEELH
jgi:hypothetical protein